MQKPIALRLLHTVVTFGREKGLEKEQLFGLLSGAEEGQAGLRG
jgi:hypothetical protein